MRQVVLESPRQLRIEDASVPTPSASELLVEVKATAICGTDIHIYAGQPPVNYPRVPGHEVAGVVQEVGSEVTAFGPGDAVVVNPNLDCGNCERCVLGKENLCVNIALMGRDAEGTLREFLTIPEDHAFKMPTNVSFTEAALIQPLSTVVHAQRLADIKPTESVVVLGQGGTGLMHTQLSRLAGASPLIAVGRSQWKLDLASQSGADVTISAAQDDPVAEVLRLTGGQGADVVIESVGTPDTIQQALLMTKPGGRLIVFGISPEPLPSLSLYQMYLRETTMIFPRATTRADYYQTVSLVASGRLDLAVMITKEYALQEASEAFRFAEEQQSKVLRLVMIP